MREEVGMLRHRDGDVVEGGKERLSRSQELELHGTVLQDLRLKARGKIGRIQCKNLYTLYNCLQYLSIITLLKFCKVLIILY